MLENLLDFKNGFNSLGEVISLILEVISVLCIVIGTLVSIQQFIRQFNTKRTPMHIRVRLKFGGWLALALEYQLASDIVGTTIAPTNEHLIRLAAIALIRTFLNYFLNREIQEEAKARKILTESGMMDER